MGGNPGWVLKNNDDDASSRIAACGLHPGYGAVVSEAVVARMRPEGSHLGWRPCSPDVIRGSSGVEKIDDGASPRIPLRFIRATGFVFHPGYRGRGLVCVITGCVD